MIIVNLPSIAHLWHERVFEAGGESSTSSSSESTRLDLVDTPIVSHGDDVFRLMPISSLQGTVDEGVIVLVDVGKDAILVLQVAVAPIPPWDHAREDQIPGNCN